MSTYPKINWQKKASGWINDSEILGRISKGGAEIRLRRGLLIKVIYPKHSSRWIKDKADPQLRITFASSGATQIKENEFRKIGPLVEQAKEKLKEKGLGP